MTQKEKLIFVDSLFKHKKGPKILDFPLSRFVLKYKKSFRLYSKRGVAQTFYSEKSSLYLTQDDLMRLRNGEKVDNFSRSVDGLIARKIQTRKPVRIKKPKVDIYLEIKNQYADLKDYFLDLFSGSMPRVSLVRMWNVSIVGSLIFGMFLMTMVYRYLGQGVSAGSKELAVAQNNENSLVLGDNKEKEEDKNGDSEEANDLTLEILAEYAEKNKDATGDANLEVQIRKMVKGYPIEKMVSEIAKKDKKVAAFLVGIAKKESNWGKRVPVYKGKDCYNYWGYKGKRDKMGTGGHTCFDSPKDAVDTVAKRIEFLVFNEKLNTPGKMVVWKCGYDCSWDSKEAVKKWISDVDKYFSKLNSAK